MKLSGDVPVHALRVLCFALLLLGATPSRAASYVEFAGDKSTWHDGFARYDYMLDEQTLEIQPFKRSDDERTGIKDPPAGKRRCVVVVPKTPAEGNPWSWQGCYWNHEPQAEVELLRRGFHIAYVSANASLKPDKTWEAWYAWLTEQHGLSPKPAFVGMSRGGEYAYTWAARHPDKVSCIYADNPAINAEGLSKLGELARADVPLLHVCGSIDPLLAGHSNTVEAIYRQLGGRISVIIKEGAGHHPHSLRDPRPIADFVVQSQTPAKVDRPDFLSGRIMKSAFYSSASAFQNSDSEGTWLTQRGPFFTACYDQYSFEVPDVEGNVRVILPKALAAGQSWVYRADQVTPESAVDLALLAKGFAIVTGPVPYNADGPSLRHWNKVYEHLTGKGFSPRPLLAGSGGAAGEAYAWAIANPDKVMCIYAENPLLRCTMTKQQPLDHLEVLAKARVPILHACGRQDPLLDSQTRIPSRKYQELGGTLKVVITEDQGHYPTTPRDVAGVIEFITQSR